MNVEVLLNVTYCIFLIAVIITITILTIVGTYWFIRFAMNEFKEIREWEYYYRDKYYKDSEKLKNSYDEKIEEAKKDYEKKLHDETEKILIEFYRNDPNNPNNKKKDGVEKNEVV